MKALFFKELRQGRPLLIFAVALGPFIAAGHWVFGRSVYYRFHAGDLHDTFGMIAYGAVVSFAFFAGAGLFAGEGDRGTLPVLLGLPFSRRCLWLVKAGAGLALLVAAAGILFCLLAVLAPQVASALFSEFIWDLTCWALFCFAASVFASTLVSNTTGALGLGLGLAGAVAGGAVWVVLGLGGPLLGYDQGLDAALWCLLVTPVLLLASARVLRRGELLHSRRRWWQGARLLAAGLAAVLLLVSGAARFATRYRADRVIRTMVLASRPVEQTGAVALESLGYPVGLARIGGRWVPRSRTEGDPHVMGPDYRGDYQVVIDLATGREAASWRTDVWGSAMDTACSRDGRRVASISGPDGITWQKREFSRRRTLRILALPGGRVVYSGWPRALGEPGDGSYHPSWSPSGRYLALVARGEHNTRIRLFDDRGRFVRMLPLMGSAWRWSPNEDVIYAQGEKGQVVRLGADGSSRVVWRPEHAWLLIEGMSPDGRWLLLDEGRPKAGGTQIEEEVLWAVRSDGGEPHPLLVAKFGEGGASAAWTGDSRVLYVAVYESYHARPRMLRWAPGLAAPEAVSYLGPLDAATRVTPFTRPKTAQIVLWVVQLGPKDKRHPIAGRVLLVDSRGSTKESPAGHLARDYRLAAFDPKGRALLSPRDGRDVLAVDLDTGAAERVYPRRP